jgi:hypothetical protein
VALAVAVAIGVAVSPAVSAPVAASALPVGQLAAATAGSLGASMLTAAATPTPQQAVSGGAGYSAARGITSYVTVIDRRTGTVLARTGNASTQVASESVVKLLIAAFYRVRYGTSMSATMNARLTQMIRCSDDGIASSYWTNDIVPAMAARYGLTHTANNPGNPGYWGRTRITADDIARLLYRVDKDPLVGGWLFQAMLTATDLGCDGFNQNFGFNAIAGAGSKQGWGGDNWTAQPYAVHSVGFTSRYLVAVLQTGNPGRYATMPGTATYTARLIARSVTRYPTYPKTQADRFTSALYRQLLGRSVASPAQSAYLQLGTRSKVLVAGDLSISPARRIELINLIYRECLGRNATPAAGRTWTARLVNGNLKDLYVGTCGAPEALTRTRRDYSKWAATTLRSVWHISPTAAQIDEWASTAKSRGLVLTVDAMARGPHFQNQWIDRLYLAMLGRHATAADRAAVTDSMRTRGLFRVTAEIAASGEYWHRWVG